MGLLARAEDGSTLELHQDSDNLSALQAFLDGTTAVLLPAGRFPISGALNVGSGKFLRGRGVDRTTLVMVNEASNNPVIGLGGNGLWSGSAGRTPAEEVRIIGICAEQMSEVSAYNKCIFVNESCHNFYAEKVRVKGSSYEGIVAGSSCVVVNLKSFEAVDCGNGGPAYALSTAGINATSAYLTIDGFTCTGCGQGVETGNSHVTVRNGTVVSPGAGLPSIGINIGSTGWGIWEVSVEDCIVRGYPTALSSGNGIGRLAGVSFTGNDVDGSCSFAGGQLDNTVHHDNEGPSTEGSFFTGNTVRVNSTSAVPFIYSSGINATDGVMGREPITVSRNNFIYDGQTQTTPTISFAGNIVADCIAELNFIFGLDSAPSRGDVASFTNVSNPAIPGMPNLAVRANIAYNSLGKSRAFSIKKEA